MRVVSRGDGGQNVQSVCETIATSDVAEILRDLCFWQSLATSMSLDELTEKIENSWKFYIWFDGESYKPI